MLKCLSFKGKGYSGQKFWQIESIAFYVINKLTLRDITEGADLPQFYAYRSSAKMVAS